MNREILFRGKGNPKYNNGDWCYGYLLFDGEDYQIVEPKHYSNCKTVLNETVGEFTGMTDKNGTKIFEGDIIKTSKFGTIDKVYVVKYDEMLGAFIGSNRNFYFTTFDGDSDQFEVIGNIWDK